MSDQVKQEVEQVDGEFNPFAIFATKVEDIKSFDEKPKTDWDSIFYEPTPVEGKPYLAAIKFLPNILNPLEPAVSKFSYKLEHPDNPKLSLYYDSPSTIGERCVVLDEWSRLYNSEDARDKNLAKKYKRTRQKCSVIQILKDPQRPELDGQIRLWRYQFDGDIDLKIKSKIKPTKEEMEMDDTVVPTDVFNPFGSPTLKLNAILTENGRDFAGSSWNDKTQGMFVDGVNVTVAQAGDKEIQGKIVELLKADNVNIADKFAYKPSDENRLKLIAKAIAKMSNGVVKLEDVATETESATTTGSVKEEAVEQKSAASPESAEQKKDVLDELGLTD